MSNVTFNSEFTPGESRMRACHSEEERVRYWRHGGWQAQKYSGADMVECLRRQAIG